MSMIEQHGDAISQILEIAGDMQIQAPGLPALVPEITAFNNAMQVELCVLVKRSEQ